jgi:peptide/nickel transport system substrate-binding protein
LVGKGEKNMHPHKRIQIVMSVIIALTFLLTACGTAAPAIVTQVVKETQLVKETQVVKETQIVQQIVEVTPTPAPHKPVGTFTMAISSDMPTMELPYFLARNQETALRTMYDSLVEVKNDGTIVPCLAESWDISSDGKEYTFHLRKNVAFHNGEPFTAEAVRFTWDRYNKPEVPNYQYFSNVTNVEVVDDYTVKVTTKEADPLFLRGVADLWAIIPPKYYQQVGVDGFANKPVGTGPFMFEEWVKGDHFTVVANPNYWREGYPLLERVVFKTMVDSSTRVAAIQAGEIDMAPQLSAEEAKSLMGLPDIQVLRYGLDRIYYVAFNNLTTGKGTPVEDINVRKAFAYAIDVQAILNSLFDGFAKLAVGQVSSVDLGYDNAPPVPYDPAKAKELLATAGYPNGFSIGMACGHETFPHMDELCQAIAGYLKEVGIQVNLEIIEANTFWDKEAKKELPPVFVEAWGASTGEANMRIIGQLKKDEVYANWYDPDIEALLLKTVSTMDRDERAKLYGELQVMMRDNPPFVYLYEPVAFEAIRTRLEGYEPRPVETFYIWPLSVSDQK